MSFYDLCKKRYSERKFSDIKVENEKIERILEVGRIAPSAHNYQPWRFYVLKSKEALDKLKSVTKMSFNAPLVILVGYDIDEAWKSEKDTYYKNYNAGESSCSIAMTMMMMQATDMGLKSCWIRDYNTQDLIDIFYIEENIKLVGFLDIGYGSEDSKPSLEHNNRRELKEIVKYL